MFTVYIIKSESSGKWYCGYTERLSERIIEHNNKNGHFTDSKGPWVLIFRKIFDNKTDAMKFEKELKKTRNKNYIERVYAEFFINGPQSF